MEELRCALHLIEDDQLVSNDVKATHRFVVHSGNDSFAMGNGVRAATLPDLQAALTAAA